MQVPMRYCLPAVVVFAFMRKFTETMIEIYKSINHISPSLVWEFHEKKSVEYNLRTKHLCKLPTIISTSFGLESLSFRGSFLWNTLDDSIKNEPTLLAFKNKINMWPGKEYTRRICR